MQSSGARGDPSECFKCFPSCVSISALLLFTTIVYGVGFPGFHRITRMRKQTLFPGKGANSFPDQRTLFGRKERGTAWELLSFAKGSGFSTCPSLLSHGSPPGGKPRWWSLKQSLAAPQPAQVAAFMAPAAKPAAPSP